MRLGESSARGVEVRGQEFACLAEGDAARPLDSVQACGFEQAPYVLGIALGETSVIREDLECDGRRKVRQHQAHREGTSRSMVAGCPVVFRSKRFPLFGLS